ncbi:ferrochelatase [Pseudoxanthomonas dokdonensis]|uniref:Ferrochelatase n=1 Tax=Pseudoxanthomonas dokdonensis TaxID=344882 RepID=A0A0R0CFW1_9GAMM|nr:ferrochelatase [Pseudoxanthomonas dokdonensis]KRG68389.1 ferrochelatase [Pseudoxanthomonas dokdonensis]
MSAPPASPERHALLLVNLGTPDAPTPPAVRRYLREFLSDPRVVQIPRLLWLPLLNGVILPLRGKSAAHKYAQIWLPEGSPLAVYTRRLAEAMQAVLPQMTVLHAMRYGSPGLAAQLQQLRQQGCRRLTVLPLYPQYSTTTTASITDVLDRHARDFELDVIEDYSVNPHWVAAVAAAIGDWRQRHGAGEHLLFSFHGLPQRVADNGDPYPQRCQASVAAIVESLGLRPEQWSLSYQSRFGKERWLAPASDQVLAELQQRGVRRIDVVCPGFAVDCLETLEEVAMGFAAEVSARGGQLRYIPCLNDSPGHAHALAAMVGGSSSEADDATE